MTNEDYPPILDAAHVAELLGMNVQMVRKYAREGFDLTIRWISNRQMKGASRSSRRSFEGAFLSCLWANSSRSSKAVL